MKISRKLAAAAVLVAASFIVAPIAQAGLANVNYSTTLPNLQQPRVVGNQTKTYGSQAGRVYVANVGSSYLVNARLYESRTHRWHTEVRGLNDGQYANLPNNIAAGTSQIQLGLTNNTWALVTVSINGNWRSN